MRTKRSKSLSPARHMGATPLHSSRGASKPDKRARSLSPLYPRPKRIGGGYDWEPLPDLQQLLRSPRQHVQPDGSRMLHGSAARAAKAARKRMYRPARAHVSPSSSSKQNAWALKAAPGQKDVYTEYELSIIAEMLFIGENGRPRASTHMQMTLATVLHSYESILRLHGIDKGHDTFFYRFLLRLALNPAASWWDRFQEECDINEQLASKQMLKEHDRAVLANAVNQWRGAQHSAPVSPQVHGYSSAVPAHASGYRQWQEQPGVEQPSDDVRSESLDSLHIHAWRGAASESTNSIGTSAELSLADLPTPAGHQLPKQSIWSLIDLAEAKLEQELRLASPPRWAAAAACAAEALRRLRCMDRAATQRRCLVGWRGSARGASQQWHLANELARLRALRIIIKAWAELAACRRRRSHAVHSAWSRRKQARMQHAFASWQAYCAEAWQDWRLAESHVEARARRHTLRAWQISLQARQMRRQRLMIALSQHQHRQAAALLYAASVHIQDMRLWRDMVSGTSAADVDAECKAAGADASGPTACHAQGEDIDLQILAAAHQNTDGTQSHHLHQFAAGGAEGVLKGWRALVNRAQRNKATIAACVARLRNQHIAGALATWRAWSAHQVSQKRLVQRAVHRLVHHHLHAAFSSWRTVSSQHSAERAVMARAILHMLNITKAHAWRAWREGILLQSAKRADIEQAVGFWRKHELLSAFRSWQGWMAQRHELKQLAGLVIGRMCLSSQARALAGWKDHHAWHRCKLQALSECIGTLQSGKVRRAFCSWQLHTSSKTSQMAKARTCLLRLTHQGLSRAFNSWRTSIAAKLDRLDKLGTCLSRLRHHLLHAAFDTWKVWGQGRLARLEKGRACVIRLQQRSLTGAFNVWHHRAQWKVASRSLVVKVLMRLSQRTLGSAFHAWLGHTATCQHLHGAQQTIQNVHLACIKRAAVGHWHQTTIMKAKMRKAVKRLVLQNMWQVFHSWQARELAAEQMALDRACCFWSQGSLLGAFNQWVAVVEDAKWTREKMQQAVVVMQNHTVMRAWWAWQDFCTHQQQARERASHALALMLRQTQARAFHAWQEALETKQWRLDCYVWTLQLWQKNTISKAWTAWLEAHEEARSQNQMLQQCVLRWQAQALAQNFYAWQDAAQRQKYVREKLLTCVGHLQHGMLASAFCAWIDFAQQRQMKAAKLQAAVQRWSRSAALVALHQWNAAAVHCAVKRQKMTWFLQRLLQSSKATAFAGWQAGAAACCHKRQQAVRAAGHFLHQRLGACFLMWKACTQQQLLQQDQLHAALLHWTQGSLGRSFSSWQAWVSRRVCIRIKVAGLLSSSETRIKHAAWEMWYSFAWKQQEKRRLVTLAHDHCQHKLAAEVLNAFRSNAQEQQVLRKVASHWRCLTLSSAFAGWKERCIRRRTLQDRLLSIAMRINAPFLASAMAAWKDYWAMQVAKKHVMAGVMKRWDNVRALGALNQWRDAVDRRQAQRQAALSALSFWTRQGQAKAFYAWHEEVVMSYNHHMAGRVHGLHLKAHAYQAWHEHTARVRQQILRLQAAMLRWSKASLTSAFAAWVEHTNNQAEKRAVVGNVIQYMLHSKLTGAFEAWITWTVERQDRRQKAERLIRRWQAWNLASAFRAFQTNRLYCQRERLADMHFEKLSLRHALHMWQSEARAQALHSDKLMVAAMRWRQMSLASAFSAWVHWHQEHCQQQQFLDLVLRRWAHGHTSHAFATWQHWAQEQRALRATALQCILRLRHRQLASAFNALHSRAMYSRMKRHCIWMWRQRTLTAIFLAFRINTYKSQCARRALRFWSGKTVVRTFQAWRTFKTRRHYLSQTLAKALASWKSQTLAQAFAGWQDGALALQRKRLLLTRALGTFQHRQLHTALAAWRDGIEEVRHGRTRAAAALAFMQNATLWAAWRAWLDAAIAGQQKRLQQLQAASCFRSFQLRAAWNSWTAFTKARLLMRQKISWSLGRMMHSNLASCWNLWRQATLDGQQNQLAAEHWRRKMLWTGMAALHEQCKLRRLANKGLRNLMNGRLSRAWASWVDHIQDGRAQQQQASALHGKVMARMRHAAVWSAFATWWHCCTQRKAARNLLQRLVWRYVSAAFNSWAGYAARIARANALLRHVLQSSVAACFERWRDHTADVRDEQKAVEATSALLARSQTFCQKIFYALNRWHSSWRLMDSFHQWKSQAQERKVFRALTGAAFELRYVHLGRQVLAAFCEAVHDGKQGRKALIFWQGNAAHQSFQIWRGFCQQQQSKQQKIAKALEWWHGRSLASLFKGWRSALQEQKQLRTVSAQVVWRHMAGLTQRALRGWKEGVAWQKTSQQRLDNAHALLADRKLCLTFDAWRNRCVEEHNQRVSISILQGRATARRMLGLLANWSVVVRQRRAVTEAIAMRLAGHYILKPFVAWREAAMWWGGVRRLTASALALYTSHSQAQVFCAWRQTVRKRRLNRDVLKAALGRLCNHTVAAAFSTWKGWAQQHISHRSILHILVQRRRDCTRVEVFQAWREAAHRSCIHQCILKGAIGKLCNQTLAGAFRGWQQAASGWKCKRERLAAATSFFMHATLRQAWATWTEMIEQLALERQQAAQALTFWTYFEERQAFRGWKEACGLQQAKRRLQRLALGRFTSVSLAKAFTTWQSHTTHKRQQSDKLRQAMARLQHCMLARAFSTWTGHTTRSADLRQRLTKAVSAFQNSAARAAFNAWLDNTQQMREGRAQAMHLMALRFRRDLETFFTEWRFAAAQGSRHRTILRKCLARFRSRSLALSFQEWAYQAAKAAMQRRADVHAHSAYLAQGLAAFAVNREHAILARAIGCATRLQLSRRAVLVHWRAVTGDRRELREKGHILLELIGRGWVREAFQWWRGIIKAEACFRRMRLRAALTCWAKHIATRRHWAERLRGATNILMFGSLARTFTAWHVHARDMGIRQRAFAQKQKSIQAALEIGDGIARRERRLLLKETFLGWCMRARLGSVASARFRKALAGTQQLCWTSWKAVYCHKRQKAGLLVQAAARANRNSLHRWFQAWRSSTDTAFHLRQERLAEAAEFAFAQTLGWTFHSWRAAAGSGKARREALQGTLQDLFARLSHEQGPRTWLRRWRSASTRARQTHMRAQMLAQQRSQRLQQSVFSVWASYTAAMQSDPDPASPFASPRTPLADRHLIQHLALMTGHELTLCSSSHSAAGESAASEPS
ncbi:hypothetical protein WJX74_005058 [Apatococcus lobatus]|uniref:Sfi1 spindle body domain-containing protein n=1 Tax=Apatococcus lobatus TaxID=904363 RepID=A0AAW1RPC4_9CHLO